MIQEGTQNLENPLMKRTKPYQNILQKGVQCHLEGGRLLTEGNYLPKGGKCLPIGGACLLEGGSLQKEGIILL